MTVPGSVHSVNRPFSTFVRVRNLEASMNRSLLALIVSLSTASLAQADVLPSIPLPRVILIDHTISTEKGIPGTCSF